jgi:hypothetical protein
MKRSWCNSGTLPGFEVLTKKNDEKFLTATNKSTAICTIHHPKINLEHYHYTDPKFPVAN